MNLIVSTEVSQKVKLKEDVRLASIDNILTKGDGRCS